MIFLTDMEENCRRAAVTLILEREKDYPLFGMQGITIKSVLCSLGKLHHDGGEGLLGYFQSGVILAVTVPLTKIYFLTNKTFHILKSNRDRLEEFAIYIERSTLRVV